jgi:hypothetical protein
MGGPLSRRRLIERNFDDFKGIDTFKIKEADDQIKIKEDLKPQGNISPKKLTIKRIRDWHEKVTLVMAGLLKVSPAEKKKIKEWYINIGSTNEWQRWMKNLELSRSLFKQSQLTPSDRIDSSSGEEEEIYDKYTKEELEEIAREEGINLNSYESSAKADDL